MEQSEKIETYHDGVLINTHVIEFTPEDILRLETEKYQARKSDGEKAFLSFAAELRLKKINNELTDEVFENIELLLLPVRTEITLGQWKSALIKLNLINPTDVGQELFDKIHLMITNYILNNY